MSRLNSQFQMIERASLRLVMQGGERQRYDFAPSEIGLHLAATLTVEAETYSYAGSDGWMISVPTGIKTIDAKLFGPMNTTRRRKP